MPYKSSVDAKARHQRYYQAHREALLDYRRRCPQQRITPHKPRTLGDKATQRATRLATRAFIRELKTETPCHDCNRHWIPEVMEFDHVRGIKLFELSNCASRSLKAIGDEIAKCHLVCANCHRIRTVQRQHQG